MKKKRKTKKAVSDWGLYAGLIRREFAKKRREEQAAIESLGPPHAVFVQTYEDDADDIFGVWKREDGSFIILHRLKARGAFSLERHREVSRAMLEAILRADKVPTPKRALKAV